MKNSGVIIQESEFRIHHKIIAATMTHHDDVRFVIENEVKQVSDRRKTPVSSSQPPEYCSLSIDHCSLKLSPDS